MDGRSPEPKESPEPEPEDGVPPEKPAADDTNLEIEELDVIENPEADPSRQKALKDAAKAKEKAETEKNGKDQEQVPTRARDLKVVYEQVKSEKKVLESKLAETTAQLEKVRTANPDEIKALSERLQKAEARRDELESEMRHVNFTQSEEYKNKFEQPYHEAWERAVADLKELTVETDEGNRAATVEDLVQLSNMPLGEARKAASAMFGMAADDVMAHRRTILDLSKKQNAALEESRKASAERSKTQEVAQREQTEKLTKVWNTETEAYAKRFPKWFKPVDGDAEGNALLEKGFSEVDRYFLETLAPDEKIKMHVKIRAKAANHDRMALRLQRAAGRIKKLQEDLAEYEGAEPPAGKVRRGVSVPKKAGNVFEEAASEIEALDEP